MAKGKKGKKAALKVEDPPVQEDDESDDDGPAQDFGDDDESIDDDEAFNSEDERKYGEFFSNSKGKNDGDSDDESVTSNDDDDSDDSDDDSEEGDGGQYMLDLLNKLDAPGDNGKQERAETMARAAAANKVAESEYASSVVKKGSLTLDSLMEGLQDTKGFGVMQKSLKKIAQGETTQAPVAKVVSKRVERKVHYENQAKEVSAWLEAVQVNRQAESLDFRNKERMNVTRENLIEKFVPTTDFEKAVHAALQEAGQEDEEAILKAEEAAFMAQKKDDLGMNDLTLEEYKKRRGDLAKMRALMFYHEQKRHRINKIKSKKYRRIRKKQRERSKESEMESEVQENPDLLRELEEKDEYDRMKERMTLAHKNTSKWAKRILKRGKNVDPDTRKALSAQLQRGDDLLKRMKHGKDDGDSDDSESEDLVESARKVLQDAEDSDNDDSDRKGLFKLKFMQRGIEKQREIAKEEARQLLRELEANEKLDDYDEAVMYDDDDKEEESAKKKRKVASKESMKDVLDGGELVVSSLKFGKSNSVSTSGGIDIDLGTSSAKAKATEEAAKAVTEHTATMKVAKEDAGKEEDTKTSDASKRKARKKKQKKQPEPAEEEANPWISSSKAGSSESGGKAKKPPSALKTGVVDVERVLDVLDDGAGRSRDKAKKASGSPSDDTTTKDEPKSITMLSQEELVRRAFATSTDNEVEEEFAKEKAEVEDEDNDTKTASQRKKEKNMAVVSGWGSWTGEGAPAPRPPQKLPKHLQPPKKKVETKRKRQDAKRTNVIIREKRIKKTADKFMLKEIPYPFKSREEYERAMHGSVGKEWNVTKSVKEMTRPEIQSRPGKIIQPLSFKAKKHRAPAKF